MWEHFFKNEKKNLNPYIEKMITYKNYVIYREEEIFNKKNNWDKYFENSNPLYLEVGCGSGNFLTTSAINNKNLNYIGIELRFKRIVSSAKKSTDMNLKNISFIRRRIQDIENIFGKEEVSKIFIFFPEPWEKEKRRSNRVLNDVMLDKYNNVLKSGGIIHFKTDHKEYFEDVKEMLKSRNDFEIVGFEDLNNICGTETEFEKLFKSKNIKFNYMEICKR